MPAVAGGRGEFTVPTDTDVKLAGDLADLRVEVADRLGKLEAGIAERSGNLEAGIAERFGHLEAGIAERFGRVEAETTGFRNAVDTELRIIRRLGTWLLGGVFGLVATLITGAATIGWAASAVNSKVEQQGNRLDALEKQVAALGSKVDRQGQGLEKIESRLEVIGSRLDTLISRAAPKPGG